MKIYYFLSFMFVVSLSYGLDKDDVYVEGIGLVSFDAEQKSRTDQKQCDDAQGTPTTDTVQMAAAEIMYQRVKEVTRDEHFLQKTQLHKKIGGKRDKPCIIAQQISRAIFDYVDGVPIMVPAAYHQWLKLNVAFEKDLFKTLFEKYPDVLKQEKIARLSCALAEKWKFTERV